MDINKSITEQIVDKYIVLVEGLHERGRELNTERMSWVLADVLSDYCYDKLGVYNKEIEKFINTLCRNF